MVKYVFQTLLYTHYLHLYFAASSAPSSSPGSCFLSSRKHHPSLTQMSVSSLYVPLLNIDLVDLQLR